MKIGILCAMQEEADLIIKKYGLQKADNPRFEVYIGEHIILLVSRIGKIYAALGTQALIQGYKADIVINIGLAGGLTKEFSIGSVFLGKKCIQHDAYLPWNGDHLNYIKGEINLSDSVEKLSSLGLKDGIILTGDQFVDDKEKHQELATKGDIVEMEAFAVASACKLYNVPCVLIKAISDNAEEEAIGDFEENVQLSMKNSLPVLEKVIDKILSSNFE